MPVPVLVVHAAVLMTAATHHVEERLPFAAWAKAKAETKTLLVEYTQTRRDTLLRKEETFDCRLVVRRLPDGSYHARCDFRSPDKKSDVTGLVRGTDVYVINPKSKTVDKHAMGDPGSVRTLLSLFWMPHPFFFDEGWARTHYEFAFAKREKHYLHFDLTPRTPEAKRGMTRGRLVLMRTDGGPAPRGMPAALTWSLNGSASVRIDVKRWRVNAADAGGESAYAVPERNTGEWSVSDANGRLWIMDPKDRLKAILEMNKQPGK